MRYAVVALVLCAASPAAAQSRITEIAAEFTKSKDVAKTRHGVTTRKFKDVVSEPWRAGLRDYAGRYVALADASYLEVRVDANGVVTARGSDHDTFTVDDARIEDAVLYGTKVYRDGRREPLEAGFLRRSARLAPGERFTISYGIGMLVDAPAGTGISGVMHVFMRKP